MGIDLTSVGSAIGTLGIAAFGLVGTFKFLPHGISNARYTTIERVVQFLFPGQTRKEAKDGHVKRLLNRLYDNWIKAPPLADQKAIAKSLIKLQLNEKTAATFAKATDVDPAVLSVAGKKMTTGQKFEDNEANAFGRFDLVLTAILNDGYQHADQRYRSDSKLAALIVSVLLAVAALYLLDGTTLGPDSKAALQWPADLGRAIFVGVLATPLAPISKDLASALQARVKVQQSLRK